MDKLCVAAGEEDPLPEVFERVHTACVSFDILDLFVQTFTRAIAFVIFPAVLYVLPVMTYGVGCCAGGGAFGSTVGAEPFCQGARWSPYSGIRRI